MAGARRIRERARLAVLLALVGGYVDAVGYLALFHVFVAHMSGNTTGLGVSLAEGNWAEAVRRAFPIPLFVAGLLLGAAVSELFVRRGARSPFAWLFGLEAVLLLLFLLLGGPTLRGGEVSPRPSATYYLLGVLPPLAMGVQSTSLHRVGGWSVRTTFITGALTSLAEQAVRWALWLWDHATGPRRRPLGLLLRLSPRQDAFRHTAMLLALWSGYFLGAIAGAWAQHRWELLSLAVPVACLAGCAALDAVRPISPPPPGP